MECIPLYFIYISFINLAINNIYRLMLIGNLLIHTSIYIMKFIKEINSTNLISSCIFYMGTCIMRYKKYTEIT